MKYYLAPMEGITGYVYRNAYEKFFHNIDKYFTPFIVANESKKFKTKELHDVLPVHNENINVVPQILTNNSEHFICTARRLKELGYNEINLNLGCPSGTVVSKFRGSGFLAKREELDIFLDEIFKIQDMKISIKTRLGMEEPEEFYELLNIYNKYPLEELIIHPRTRKDYYKNTPNLELFKHAVENSKAKVCYNGDIFTVEGYDKIIQAFPEIDTIMLGRGIIANPGLLTEIIDRTLVKKEVIKAFHDEVLNGYMEVFKGQGDKNVLFKMKEFWCYMIYIFSDNKKYFKKIKKSQDLKDYNEAVNSLFRDQDIVEGAGLFSDSI